MSDRRYYWDIKRVLVVPSMGNNSAEPPLNELLDKGWEYLGREIVTAPDKSSRLLHIVGLPKSVDDAKKHEEQC